VCLLSQIPHTKQVCLNNWPVGLYNLVFLGMAMPDNAAPPAGAVPQAPRTTVFNLLLNAALVYFAYNAFFTTKASPKELSAISNAQPNAPAVVTAVPVVEMDDTPGLLQMMQGKKVSIVPRELQWYEQERKASLAALPPNSIIKNAWRSGTVFDMFVVVSEHSDRITNLGDITSQEVSGTDYLRYYRPTSQNAISLGQLLSSSSNLYDLTVSPPAVQYPNATFGGLLRLQEQSVVEQDAHEEARENNRHKNPGALMWTLKGLTFDWDDRNYRSQHFNVSLPRFLQQNSSAFAHIFFVRQGYQPSDVPALISEAGFHLVYPMTILLKHKPSKAGVNLLGGDSASAKQQNATFGIGLQQDVPKGSEDSSPKTAASHTRYWRPALHVQMVHDFSSYGAKQVPPHIAPAILVNTRSETYAPISLVNDFWLLGHQLVELNASVTEVPLEITFSLQSMWKWALQAQMQSSWDMQAAMGAQSDGDTDLFKSIVLESNPVLLTITMLVSTLHMVFDMLAFKNDISFWRSAKSMEGLSVRSISVNVFFQVVILLYLLENDTSYMILMSSVVGLGIEIWKLRKAVSVAITWNNGGPSLQWEDAEDTYAASHTKEYDDIATNHMLFILYPLVVGYAVYSLFFERHRSWLSWILSSLTGFVYTFGFIQMVPQLYINYRLKSVAHMPWRAMIYKSLNTFIDDLFAWVIKMPT
jgi:hypothetical protein